ncbi:sec14 [Symbiodinium sp. KB8]|nr:sec14 [Symbiodinium sp. KB8]
MKKRCPSGLAHVLAQACSSLHLLAHLRPSAEKLKAIEELKAAIRAAAAKPKAKRKETEELLLFCQCVKSLAGSSEICVQLKEILPRIGETHLVPLMGIKRPAPRPVEKPSVPVTANRAVGRVKSYNTRKGFGFITVPDFGRDIFVYNSHLIGRIGLLAGETVSFDLIVEGGRPQARNVKVLGGDGVVPDMIGQNSVAEVKKALAQGPRTGDQPSSQTSVREMTLAMAAAAAEVPTTLPQKKPQQETTRSMEEILKEQIRKAQTEATTRKTAPIVKQPPTVSFGGQQDARPPATEHEGNLPKGSTVRVVGFPSPDVDGCRDPDVKVVRKRKPKETESVPKAPADPAPKRGGPLLSQRGNKKAKAPLTVSQRQARNRRLTEQFRDDRLRASFGRSRDNDPVNRKTSLIPEELWEDGQEVAPTRKKVSKLGENIEALSKKPDAQLSDLLTKDSPPPLSIQIRDTAEALQNMRLREEYLQLSDKAAADGGKAAPAAPPPQLPGGSSQGLQKSAADALRKFGPLTPQYGSLFRPVLRQMFQRHWLHGAELLQSSQVDVKQEAAAATGKLCTKPVMQLTASNVFEAMQQAQMGPGAMGNMAAKIESLGDELKRDGIEVAEQELLAFLRATNFDQQEARARLLDTTGWRAATLVKEKLHCRDWRAKELAMRSILLYDYVGADKHGRPLLIERVGAWDIQAVLDATEDLEKFTLLHAMADETLLQMKRPTTAKDPRGFVLIVDMEGLGIWHLHPRLISAFAAVSQIDEAHYPDSVAAIFVVNAPWYFTSLFTMIRPSLNEDTYTKIHFSRCVPEEMLQCLGEDCSFGANKLSGMGPNQQQIPPMGMAQDGQEGTKAGLQSDSKSEHDRRTCFPGIKCKRGGAPEGRPGQVWVVLKSNHFHDVIVRASQEVTSRELRRLNPGEVLTQRDMTIMLPNGLVRMPVEPDGWVTVHARHINGPTFLSEAPNEGCRA